MCVGGRKGLGEVGRGRGIGEGREVGVVYLRLHVFLLQLFQHPQPLLGHPSPPGLAW